MVAWTSVRHSATGWPFFLAYPHITLPVCFPGGGLYVPAEVRGFWTCVFHCGEDHLDRCPLLVLGNNNKRVSLHVARSFDDENNKCIQASKATIDIGKEYHIAVVTKYDKSSNNTAVTLYVDGAYDSHYDHRGKAWEAAGKYLTLGKCYEHDGGGFSGSLTLRTYPFDLNVDQIHADMRCT